MIKQLESRLKLKVGESAGSNSDYIYIILLILIFMTTFDTICGEKLCHKTYFQLLDLFLENKNLIHLTQCEYLQHLDSAEWETDYAIYSFTILQDIRLLIENGEVTSYNLAWFDQNSSGPSLIAILSNSEKLAYYCNMITVKDINMDYSTLNRECIYTEFLKYCNETISEIDDSEFVDFKFDRKWAKYTLMTHYYSAGLKTASRLVAEWVDEKIPVEHSKIYEKFFNKNTKAVKEIKNALLTFCPLGTKLNNFFRKVALIVICDKSRFSKLKKAECEIILGFRTQLFQAGLSRDFCDTFFGLGYSSLRVITPFGTKIEYSTADKKHGTDHQYTSFNKNSTSAFSSFNMAKPRKFDVNQLVNSFLVNFIHCCDASILQELTKWFFENHPNSTLATVMDCFGTSYHLINVVSVQIKKCYFSLGFDDCLNLIDKCVLTPNIIRVSANNEVIVCYVYKALKNEYANDFPNENNILIKHKNSFLNSCYWYPFSD